MAWRDVVLSFLSCVVLSYYSNIVQLAKWRYRNALIIVTIWQSARSIFTKA